VREDVGPPLPEADIETSRYGARRVAIKSARAFAAAPDAPVGSSRVVFFFIVPGICGAVLTLFGIRLVLRSTADLPPAVKSQYLMFGLIASGVGLALFLPSVRVFWWSAFESLSNVPTPER
jgi:hypothetical protein